MRQAGRYLPEYRAIKKQKKGFMDLIYSPEIAAEITMQPVRRFGMDGAILFSDILVVPDAMGQQVRFEHGKGPVLEPLQNEADIEKLDQEKASGKLSEIYETVSLVSQKLKKEGHENTALIGFAGAPWTVACYMIEGGGSKDFMRTRSWAYKNPQSFENLIGRLEKVTIDYLSSQIDYGAESLQLFDSWAGITSGDQFDRWIIEPAKRITTALKVKYPDIKIIGFPKGSGVNYLKYARESGVDALSLDYSVPLEWAAETLQKETVIQGNLDPAVLLAGGAELERQAENILSVLSDGPFIFNLGHGVHKDTPVENVAALCEKVRSWRK
jgi:uroporphyrinogen decarboxylase